jgi:hypothetical protein
MPSFVDMLAKYIPVLCFNGLREATSNAELSRCVLAEIVEWYCTSMDLGKQPVMPSIANMWAKHVPVLNFNGFREATSDAELCRCVG